MLARMQQWLLPLLLLILAACVQEGIATSYVGRSCVCDGGLIVKHGDSILMKSCTRKATCVDGHLVEKEYKCVDRSACYDEKCQCAADLVSEYKHGFLVSCKAPTCNYYGQTLKSGDSVLSHSCTQKKTCVIGQLMTTAFHCCANAECVQEKCVCRQGYVAVKQNNLLVSCEEPKGCSKGGNKRWNREHGEQFVTSLCRKRYTCNNGKFQMDSYKCPSNSVCKGYRECVCKSGFKETGRTEWGLLKGCKETSCKAGDKQIKHGDSILMKSCTRKATCVDGHLVEKDYKCVHWSVCRDEKCECAANLMSEYKNGFLVSCKVPTCNYNGQTLRHGDSILMKSCTRTATCIYGHLVEKKYKCVDRSVCRDEKCECAAGLVSKYNDGYLVSCKAPTCTYFGHTLKSGDSILTHRCTQKKTCVIEQLMTTAFHCCANAECVQEECVCRQGYVAVKQNNLLVSCEEPKGCSKGDNKLWNREHGEQFVTSLCRKRYTCNNGKFQMESYKCPSNSVCKRYRECVCKPGFKETGRTEWGLLKGCKETSCKAGDKQIKHGDSILMKSCTRKATCVSGHLVEKKYKCVSLSACYHEKCECAADLMSEYKDGFLVSCKGPTCNHDGQTLESGDSILMKSCTRKATCVGGYLIEKKYKCVDRSVCRDEKCECAADMMSEYKHGFLVSCKAPTCNHDGQTLKHGDSILMKSCTRKATCVTGRLVEKNYKCVDRSACYHGKCECAADLVSEYKHGFLVSCKAPTCNHDGQTLKSGDSVLSHSCTQKMTCVMGQLMTTAFHCCANAECVQQKCVCRPGYVAVKQNNLLVSCEEPKGCNTGGNKLWNREHGEQFVTSLCRKRYTCNNGKFQMDSYKCPSNSVCKRYRECVCKPGFKEAGRTEWGLLKGCKETSCKAGDKQIKHGEAILLNHCSVKAKCEGGQLKESPGFFCCAHSKCVKNKCVCQWGYTPTYQDGIVTVCKAGIKNVI